MSTPFLATYASNASKSMAFAVHTTHFLPTRDCALGPACLFTYKDTGTTGTMPSDSRRGRIPRFTADVFGELVVMEELPRHLGYIFGFTCPTDATCSAADLYWQQLAALQAVLDIEKNDEACVCVGSWFALPSDGTGDRAKGVFYIYVKAKTERQCDMLRRMFEVGQLLNVTVAMQRIDLFDNGSTEREYSLLAHTLGSLHTNDIPKKTMGYACDRPIHTTLSPESKPDQGDYRAALFLALISMLDRLRGYKRFALAQAEYGRDFVPVRERTVEDGSLFLFKQIPGRIATHFTGERYRSENYSGVVFGRVDELFVIGDSEFLRFRCPDDATCAVTDLYMKQLNCLRYTVLTDSTANSATVAATWFDCTTTDIILPAIPNCFYVAGGTSRVANFAARLKTDKEVMMWVWMRRVDVGVETGGIQSKYCLDVMHYDAHGPGYFPRKTPIWGQYSLLWSTILVCEPPINFITKVARWRGSAHYRTTHTRSISPRSILSYNSYSMYLTSIYPTPPGTGERSGYEFLELHGSHDLLANHRASVKVETDRVPTVERQLKTISDS
ncbi:hypothetical protein C8R43DRAFT_947201 [Mycena crocata]|nr:hypothetical protein C8R43DRAFT_947201 [Mycena crocata]